MNPFLIVRDITQRVTPPAHPYTFPLDPFQEHALDAIAKGDHVLVCAKTGSGKTLVGEYQIYHSLSKGKRVFYTSPIKSLSNQKFHHLKVLFPEASVGIMTGDIKFRPDAQVVVMTTEILRNLLYKQNTATESLGLTASLSMEDVDAVIFDECHYMNDPDRGKVWEETFILLPRTVQLVLLSATLEHPERIASWLGTIKQRPVHLIQTQYRVVPLTHYVISRDQKLLLVMDEKENYHERVYTEWARSQVQEEKEHYRFQLRVQEARESGVKGGIEGKVSHSHYVHRLNQTVHLLEEKELLPALLFVFHRKQCETYAHRIEKSLLDTSDSATVRHILSFHLHRYQKELDQTPQYHQLVELLYRGIAFHHSGLLPVLKEVVEILFSKGFIKLLVCTETFAVGLNMPTKTVMFAGLKKYDDHVDSLRVLRSDEYLQMAGRAGRRGKDDRGVVIYLPEGPALTPVEMHRMMKGGRPEVMSRMDFHVDFVLKTLHAHSPASSASSSSSVPWLEHIQTTYWYQHYQRDILDLEKRMEDCRTRQASLPQTEPFWSETWKRRTLESQIKSSVNAARKELQRQLDTLKNRQLGPSWKKAGEDVQRWEELESQRRALEEEREAYGTPLSRVEESIGFLRACGFVEPDTERLTHKGILATEVNEGDPIGLTEAYTLGLFAGLTDEEAILFLSAFLGEKGKESTGGEDVPWTSTLEKRWATMEDRLAVLHEQEMEWCGERQHLRSLSCDWMEPMRLWFSGEPSSVICQRYELFEGNFYRTLLKLMNLLNEVISMATYSQHVEQVDQFMRLSEALRRTRWTGESLYLFL